MLRLSTLGPRRAARPIKRVPSPQLANVTASGLYPTNNYIDVTYSERIVLTSSFSNDATVAVRVAFYDSSLNFLGYSELLTVESYAELDLTDTSRKAGSLYVIANELGASFVKIMLTQNVTNSANITMYVSNC